MSKTLNSLYALSKSEPILIGTSVKIRESEDNKDSRWSFHGISGKVIAHDPELDAYFVKPSNDKSIWAKTKHGIGPLKRSELEKKS